MKTLFTFFALSLLAMPIVANAQTAALPEPSNEQLLILKKRVIELKLNATSNLEQAQNAARQLALTGKCANQLSVRSCLENEVRRLSARANLIEDPAELAATNEKIQSLQLQIDAPAELEKSGEQLSLLGNAVDQMLAQNDFTFKEQFRVIWKSLVGSWKYLISRDALTALSIGGAGFASARLGGADASAKAAFDFTPSPGVSALKEIGTLCGYGVCMVPVAMVALITKDPNSVEALDAMLVGTALVESIGIATKNIAPDPRPSERPAGSFDRWGTDSLHAGESAMMSTVICRHYGKIWCGVAIAVTVGVDLSREVRGDHYPSQLLLGTGLGIAAGYAADRAVRDQTNQERITKSELFFEAVTGNLNYKGINFDYKPELFSTGGAGGALNISW